MSINTIDIGKEFSIAPSGRYPNDSDHSGERFREEFLKPIFIEPEKYSRPVKIILDTAEGYSATFLGEAFGGLVREGYATPAEIDEALVLVHERGGFTLYGRMIQSAIEKAQEKKEQGGSAGNVRGTQ